MATIEETKFNRLIEMLDAGCSVGSSAKAIGIEPHTLYYRMTERQRDEFDYANAANLYRYELIDNLYHKPKRIKKIDNG